ncbi:MAG: phosphatidylglycerophosphatase A [Candidatus Omnitrophica bacterium]|nr:phosphatidylglycerophosphatase A [Candidatus Omnitrophota bacterium]
MRKRWASAVASIGGLGHVPKAPGTVGSAVGWACGWLWPGAAAAPLVVLVGLLGVAASTQAERQTHTHDPRWIVIDEVVGMWLVFTCLPDLHSRRLMAILAFGLFRYFDIAKPGLIRRLGRLPGGWGVMLDDVGAGVVTALVLWIALFLTHSV